MWFKVDDNLAFHRKTLRAGNAAMGMWVRAGSECSSQLTDGFVADELVAALGGKKLAEKLVDAELWMRVEGGYQFHQWSDDGRQPTRAQVEEERKAARLRKQQWRDSRRKGTEVSQQDKPGTDGGTDSGTDAGVTGGGTPTPTRPDPTRPDPESLKGLSEQQARKRATRIADGWKPGPELVEWQRTEGITDAVARRELPQFVDYWRAVAGDKGLKRDWDATWRNWLRRANDRIGATNGRPTRPEASTPW